MEKVRKAVNAIAYTEHEHLAKLSPIQLSLIPVLFFASSLYKAALSLRRSLYHFGLLRNHRLPVPVISVGNLTWGGNGKTPMVEFIARYLADSGISPLILTRGYAGGDEAKMLHRHFLGRPVKIGVGAKRAAVAAKFFERYGFIDLCSSNYSQKVGSHLSSEKIGAIILDDGMQIGAFYVDRLEFSDHHIFQAKDIEKIRRRLRELEDRFGSKPVVIVTEKDYDRDPEIFKQLDPFEVLALCSELKIIPYRGCTEDSFKKLLKVVCNKMQTEIKVC